jgi:hypothetical protein
MKTLVLRNGVTFVDDEDYDYLSQWSWYIDAYGYVARVQYVDHSTHRKVHFMHRVIMNPPKGLQVDHINHVKHDNQRSNLRLCTHQQNHQNRPIRKGKKYKGVYTTKYSLPYRTQITFNGKQIFIGTFETAHLAALAYDLWAKDLYGEFAATNFPVVTDSYSCL